MAETIPDYDDPGPEDMDAYQRMRSRTQKAAKSASSHPEGYIVHPDGFTEYFEDPEVTAQAQRDTEEDRRKYYESQRMQSAQAESAKKDAERQARFERAMDMVQPESDLEVLREKNRQTLREKGPPPIGQLGIAPYLINLAVTRPEAFKKQMTKFYDTTKDMYNPEKILAKIQSMPRSFREYAKTLASGDLEEITKQVATEILPDNVVELEADALHDYYDPDSEARGMTPEDLDRLKGILSGRMAYSRGYRTRSTDG